MKEIQLYLIPQPGSKPEFLASLQVVDPSPAVTQLWNKVLTTTSSNKVILEGYTRDAWAWKPSQHFQNITVQSTDGRNKLPGFVKYLKDRTKSCYGRLHKSLWVVSYIQPKNLNPNRIECRVAIDMTQIPNCTLQPTKQPATKQQPVTAPKQQLQPAKKKGGFLGKLVGAQHRTNQHVIRAASQGQQQPKTTAPQQTATAITRSAQQVLSDFRQSMQTKMLDFDIASSDFIKIEVSLKEYTADLSEDDKTGVTMDVLKYMVYEAAEEVNEEWIAHRESTGFLDEATFLIYKQGKAPPEVLEEINKGELPDEVRGQQRAIAEERKRQISQAEQRYSNMLESAAHQHQYEEDEDYLAALNQNKRDRRTIEDYEREKAKKSKTA